MRTGLERILINLDIGVPGALVRVLLGIVLVRVVDAVEPEAGIGLLSASLLAVLFAVKVIAALARKASSASPLVRAHWEWRRNLARYYDSYQWRKLVWFGIGILIGGAVDWPGTSAQWTLGVGCVAAGCVAEIFWRRHRLGLVPQGV